MNIFNGKVAIVTGAGSGIGKALAWELARRGAHVVMSDINAERVKTAAEGIAKDGGKVTAFILDVSNYDAVKIIVDDTAGSHGRIDYIFNNAGIAFGGPAKDFTIDNWRNVINIDLYGVVHGVAAAYPIMAKQGFGHIVNTASLEGLVPFPAMASYVTSKHGVVGLSNALRIEGADLGVKVSAVCPGHIKTAIFTDSKSVNMDREKFIQWPDWVGITPEECARDILRGVERNRALIVVTWFANCLWTLYRISPGLVMWLMKRGYRHWIKDGVIQT
jgi:NAD(P)-dependent dehydrogenase (short-subunit alcohol dehydrogenase family)